MLVGPPEVVGDAPADLQGLAVVGVVVAGRQGVGAEHDPPFDFVAEPGGAGGHVHRVGVGRRHPQAVAHAVIASQVARRLRRGDEVVGRQAVRERRHLDVDDLRSGVGERVEGGVHPFDHVRVGAGGQVGDPPDAQALGSVVEDGAQLRCRPRNRRRVTGIVATDHLQGERGVGDGGGERPDLVEARREGDEAEPADDAIRRLDPDDAAQGGRLADRPAGVAAEAQRGEAGGDRRGAPTAGTTRNARGVVWVARWSERRVLGARAHRELVEVGLADDHRPGVLQPGHDRGVVRRLPSLEDPRRTGRGDSPSAHVVLQGHRDTGQRAGVVAGDDGGVDGGGGETRLFDEYEVEGVNVLVAAGDGGEVLFEHVDRAALAGAYRCSDVQGGHRTAVHEGERRGASRGASRNCAGGLWRGRGTQLTVIRRSRESGGP